MKICFLALFFLLVVPLGAQENFREWTDQSGRKLSAKLVGLDESWGIDGLVKLELENGRIVSFPVSKLSEADRKNIAGWELRDPPSVKIDGLLGPKNPVTDSIFLRRAYLKLAGRVPIQAERRSFQESSHPEKRSGLVNQLLNSPEFNEHLFHYLSPLFRTDPKRQLQVPYPHCENENGKKEEAKLRLFQNPNPVPYQNWLKSQIAGNRPWDELVTEVLTATGSYSENPAVGYFVPERWSSLIDPAPIMTAFAGVEITCARCHNHPHTEITQLDFYRIASFFGKTRLKSSEAGTLAADIIISDRHLRRVALPPNYRYANGAPYQKVSPGMYFGKVVKEDSFPTYRAAFADWLTDSRNPRFTINIVNRLCVFAFGKPLADPPHFLPGRLESNVENYRLLQYLEKLMIASNYELKTFLSHLYHSKTFIGE